MGRYPFLSGCSVCQFDGCAYHSALELAKKLLQIAAGFFTKNNQPLAQGFLRRLTKLRTEIIP